MSSGCLAVVKGSVKRSALRGDACRNCWNGMTSLAGTAGRTTVRSMGDVVIAVGLPIGDPTLFDPAI
jgi:hypothetical protein